MSAPAIYECVVRHARRTPVRHAFAYRTYQWLVDLDELPRDRWLASFRSADHLGDPARSIRHNVEEFLAGHGIDLAGGRIALLTNARVFGHVFNPLSVYWCHRPDGSLAAVIAEVHNTYGGRHCYLLHTDSRGRAAIEKSFYVSPFNDVSGSYRLSLPEPDERLGLTVVLERAGGHPFVATLRGRRRPATTAALLRHPLVTLAVSARIRLQGVRLYLRGLPIVPRTTTGGPAAVRSAGVTPVAATSKEAR